MTLRAVRSLDSLPAGSRRERESSQCVGRARASKEPKGVRTKWIRFALCARIRREGQKEAEGMRNEIRRRWREHPSTRLGFLRLHYRAEKISLYVVARMMQVSLGRSDKQQEEQTSPNHVQRNFLSSVLRT